MLSNNSTIRPIGTVQPGIAGNAGNRVTKPLFKNVKTLAIHVQVTGTLTIGTNPASAIVDTGSILAAFTECGVNDGQDRLLTTPQDMRFMTEAFSAKLLPATRQSSLAVAAYTLRERFTIFCSPPWAANREEVSLIEHDPSGDYYFFIKQSGAADGGASLIATAGGGGTAVLSNVVVTVSQEFVATGGQLPIFQPRWETDTIPVTGTDAALLKPHLKNYYMQGVLLREEVTGVKRVGDIITSFKQQQTGRMIVGDEQISKAVYQELQDGELGGNLFTLGGTNPYTLFWYQRAGKLSKVLRPNDPNFTTTLSVAVSATAGTSRIQITYFMLDRDQTVRSDGRRVTLSDAELVKTGLRI